MKIDWEKVWKEFHSWYKEHNRDMPWMIQEEKIVEIVESQLKGNKQICRKSARKVKN